MKSQLQEGDVVLCTVEKIVGTSIFLKIEDDVSVANGQDKHAKLEGTMVASEVAAGRIRNLRDYVVPNKKIVCKILRIDDQRNINLSLRRVTSREKQEVLEKHEKERNSLSILKSILQDKAEPVASQIKEKENSLYNFLQAAKETPVLLEKYLSKEDAEKIYKILSDKKEKLVEVKKEFSLKSASPEGITIIKKILLPHKAQVSYLAAGRFVIKIKASDYKKANSQVSLILQDIGANAKKEKASFEVKEK